MSARKLSGLFLIVMGLVQIFQALSKYRQPGRTSDSLFVFVTALMFTLGAALVWWDNKWLSGDSPTHD
jgi:Mg2+ and Co2+ transporter CorA